MKKLTVSEHLNRDRLHLFFHLIPIIGFFPSLWTLYRYERSGSREEPVACGGSPRCANWRSGVGSREDKEDNEAMLATSYQPLATPYSPNETTDQQ